MTCRYRHIVVARLFYHVLYLCNDNGVVKDYRIILLGVPGANSVQCPPAVPLLLEFFLHDARITRNII